jgi:hypothetical protein
MPAAQRKAPQDRLPKQTAKTEAEGSDIQVEWQGIAYTIDRDNANNLELFEFVEDEKYIKAIRGYLGEDQWAKWKDSVRDDHGRVPADGFEGFLNAIMAAVGGSKDDHPNS